MWEKSDEPEPLGARLQEMNREEESKEPEPLGRALSLVNEDSTYSRK